MKYGSVTLGQIEAIITKLGGEDGALRFLRNDPYFIDGDAAAEASRGRTVHEHKKIGPFLWDVSRIILWQHPIQQRSGPKPWTAPQDLYRATRGRRVLNANVLDYLLKNPSLIPKEWKDIGVVFWGTLYRSDENRLEARMLVNDDGVWKSHYSEIAAAWLDLPRIYSAEY